MRQAVLDTDILSYLIDERYPEVVATARQYFRVFRYFTVSVVSVAEIIKGFEATQSYGRLTDFIERIGGFELLPVGGDEGILAGRILGSLMRTGERIGPLDPFIAATAIESRRPLVTNNIRHYQRIVDLGFSLELENWRNP
jgi:predicted nucleic acid-binding protein